MPDGSSSPSAHSPPDDRSFDLSSESVDAAPQQAREPSIPATKSRQAQHPKEVKDAFVKFRAQYPTEKLRVVLEHFEDKHNITLSEHTVRKWLKLDKLAQGNTGRSAPSYSSIAARRRSPEEAGNLK